MVYCDLSGHVDLLEGPSGIKVRAIRPTYA
jgi:hypothetical protein